MEVSGGAPKRVLILGIGNLIMSDDGIGVRVVLKLQREHRLQDGVDVMDGGTLGLDLLPALEGVSHLILVDAVATGSQPGTVVRLVGDEIPLALETRLSPHQMGLKDLLAVARLMGQMPAELVLIGVQPDSIEMGTELTPAVAKRVGDMLDSILEQLAQWGVTTEPVFSRSAGESPACIAT